MSAAPATLDTLSTVTVALATQRALAESAALRLLRAQNAPAIAAFLQSHLGGSDKRVTASVAAEPTPFRGELPLLTQPEARTLARLRAEGDVRPPAVDLLVS